MNMKLIIFMLFAVFSSEALAKKCKHLQRETAFSCLEYVRNYDGDTITVNIPNVHPIIGNKIALRIEGIDTAEIRTKDACEKKAAYEAKELVKEILTSASDISIINIKRGKYFRLVGDVLANNQSIGDILLERKLAFPYDGGTKPTIDWCNRSIIH